MFLLFPPILDRIGNSLFGILIESLVFWEQKSKSFFSKSELLSSLFFKEGWEQISSFTKSKKSDEERWGAIQSFVLGIKRGKAWWKERIWSDSLFHKEQIAPVTLYLKMTFSPVTRAKKGRTEEKIPNPDSRDTLLLISHCLCIYCGHWTSGQYLDSFIKQLLQVGSTLL